MKTPMARKYCLKATAVIYNSRQRFGKFIAYGKTLDVAKKVENACKICLQDEDTFPEVMWDDIEVTIFEECPVECDAKVHWEVIVDDPLSGYSSD